MTERPILFSGPLVRAILDGRKTVTRRAFATGHGAPCGDDYPQYPIRELRGRSWHVVNADGAGFQEPARYGVPGDRLWVRETWCYISEPHQPGGAVYAYRADGGEAERILSDVRAWRPSIHMPRAAARLFLDVVDVRVERLHDITEEEAQAEGVPPIPRTDGTDPRYRASFAGIWDGIYGTWDANPWVWRIAFRVLK